VLKRWLDLSESEATLKRAVREQEAALDALAYEKYPKLTEAEIKTLVVDDKWMARLSAAVQGLELDRVAERSQTLTEGGFESWRSDMRRRCRGWSTR
jgi:type I restriction enzyme M protein